ncbi:PGF-pre-PGF domain-containing protein [Methanosarcina sp. Z-7115]|uniref:PGF-pre-PGF domain-containing protein n=1 Tax=Methanosarcina baikalica TaxID=3073890 RepID=A0ABU2D1J1_9EURY|nr:PGF-pre-PGF domain-containing protein [Methanosarcina sp. Z-7115]MDR7665845.1 PGF-pre-PGF domain-containing protein [Methanosarcina sp. Z-7115]
MINRIKVPLIILIFIFIISSSATASAKEVTVDDSSGADFRSIQEAVNNSVPWDTIIVRPGTYTENILVNITGLTIRSGLKNSDVEVKPLDESESVFRIKADNVAISGFNITGANKETFDHTTGGICLENATNCMIKGNIFIENKKGVFLNRSSYNTVSENLFFNDELNEEIFTYQSDMNNLTGNTIENGYITEGAESSGNLIAGNKISNGGIIIGCCGRNNEVSGNMISNCSLGISAYDTGVNFSNNRITDCQCGIHLSFTGGAGVYDNTISNCGVGISLSDGCLGVEITNNTIMSSSECGIVDQYDEGGKRIYNNYFNNTVNVRPVAGAGGNTWNSSLTRGNNIAGGPYIGGNFWAKPDGTGFSQICVDLDGNGIGDLPYKIYEDPYNVYEDEFDYLPLVSLSSPQNTVTPTANFTASVTNGTAPLVVKFADLSKNAVLWNWDLDGDGISDSTKQNPVYAYKTSGNYTVNLTVSNGINTSSKLVNITVGKRVSATWPFVYITNNGAFSVIDTETGIVISSVKVGSGQGVAVSPDGKKAYVANLGSNNVSVIDTATNTVIATVNVGIDPSKVAVTQDGSKVYVVNYGSNNVSVIDTEINTVKATVPVGNTPRGIAVTPDGKKVYVANCGNNSVRGNTTSVIDTATNTVIATVPVGEHPWGVAVTPDGTKVYVTTYYYVSIIDTATNAVIATVDVTRRPQEVIVNPTGTKVYVTGGNSFVSVIDTATGKVLTTLNVGKYPEEIAVSPNGKKVYVVTKGSYENNYSNNISVIDTSNDTVSSIVNIEVSPGGIAIIPEPEPVFPVANFSSNVNEGFAPLVVKFYDSSENATEWNWDFGDGSTSTEQNPMYTYSEIGTYTVNLTASNENGANSKLTTITVLEVSSSSGGSSHRSSGGGGAGGSPEPQSNVGAKEISQTFITSGSTVKFDFPQKATPVLYLSFDSQKTAGKTTTIVEMLKGKSTLVTGLPSGEVYKYLNIWVGNGGFGDSNNIANVVINFKVEKNWIKDKSIGQSSITLNRYSDKKWNQLSTNLSGEDDKYLYFTAKTSGFSSFAITGNSTAKENKDGIISENNEDVVSDITQQPLNQENDSTSETKSMSTPGFDIVYAVICLFGVLLYRR